MRQEVSTPELRSILSINDVEWLRHQGFDFSPGTLPVYHYIRWPWRTMHIVYLQPETREEEVRLLEGPCSPYEQPRRVILDEDSPTGWAVPPLQPSVFETWSGEGCQRVSSWRRWLRALMR